MIARLLILFTASIAPCLSYGSINGFLERPVLVQELDSNGKIKTQYFDSFKKDQASLKYISTSPDMSSFGAFGICFNIDSSPCINELTSQDEFIRAMAIGNGRSQVDTTQLPPMQNIPIVSTTTIESNGSSFITVKIEQSLFNGLGNQSTRFRISLVNKLSKVSHTFSMPKNDEPNRKVISEVEPRFRDLSYGVVQINTRPDGDNLLGNTSGSGTGWFISPNGLMMTNHHVISPFNKCMQDLVCEIDFKQVTPEGRRQFTAKAAMLVFSEQHDFALLKVELPQNLKFSFFRIEKNQVGSDLITLGYPSDFSEGQDTRLTYSFGNLVGFHSRAYSTSAYIYQGASGSPILQKQSMNVVAILSNGAGIPIPGVGSPGIARPILLIDSEFGLSDYIDGTKMNRVNRILENLRSASSVEQATLALNGYRREKTFMGLNMLKRQMLTHPVTEVRLAIMRSLEKMKVLVGSSEVEDLLLENRPQIDANFFLPPKG